MQILNDQTKFRNKETNKCTLSNDYFKLICEALYHKNNKEAVETAKQLIKKLKEENRILATFDKVNLILLLLNQVRMILIYK